MKRFILAFAFIASLATGIGLMAHYYGPGYVVLSYADYSIETSFIFLLSFIVLTFFVFYYLLRLLSILMRIPEYMGLKYNNRQAGKARNALVKGLIEMAEGRFSQAEKILLKQVAHSDTGLLNYLMAARSAQQLGAYDRRDEYLRLAHESTPSADIAIGITQAELQLAHKQYEQALATLNHLNSISPKHGYVKKLQARVYQQVGDWESLGILLEEVRKHKLIDDDKFRAIEIETYSGLLAKSIKQKNSERTLQIWQSIPKRLNDNRQLLKLYINYLIEAKEHNNAEVLLRNYLTHHWHESMVRLYAKLTTSNPQQQLETAETWLREHSRSAALLLVLGKLCIKAELWGKAQNYLDSSLGIKPLSETYLQLAMLLEDRMDQPEKAQQLYQQGLNLAVSEEQGTTGSRNEPASISTGGTVPKLKVIQ